MIQVDDSERALEVEYPPFPHVGSLLNNRYLTLGRLGRGTFCSIHKCIDMRTRKLVAAKVELADFANSGVLEGEASVLKHLSDNCAGAVPEYIDYVKENQKSPNGFEDVICSAIIMEFLSGEDMHLLRDKASTQERRLHLEDAVYLTADIMLPLLEKLHNVGVLHRDVKPSNVVRISPLKDFKIVDFGLSKSFVVPASSGFADKSHPWEGVWSKPHKCHENGCIRQERPKAEFRGTSMYASLPVHKMKDYARRDDMWSLMYVFCDLLSGGLPWMSWAASRDRESCSNMKERLHDQNLEEELLKGAAYHRAIHAKEKKHDIVLPKPLEMCHDQRKVILLRNAFQHLGQLNFADKPDYNLIRKCIKGFLDIPVTIPDTLEPIQWQEISKLTKPPIKEDEDDTEHAYNSWMTDDHITKATVKEAEMERNISTIPSENDLSKLHMVIQIRLAQVIYDAKHKNEIEKKVILRDWIYLAFFLTRYPKYCHNPNVPPLRNYRNELYAKQLKRCLDLAYVFDDRLMSRDYVRDYKKENKTLGTISTLFSSLDAKLMLEMEKTLPPPPSIFMS